VTPDALVRWHGRAGVALIVGLHSVHERDTLVIAAGAWRSRNRRVTDR
jgi:hypothetical protein